MPFTNKALATTWLLILGLFALSGSGMVAGPWVLLLVGAALGVPLVLAVLAKPQGAVIATVSSRRDVPGGARDLSPIEATGVDVNRWEGDGGARHSPSSRR